MTELNKEHLDQHEQDHQTRRRKLVVFTFSTSLASFFAAVCYDYIRPSILHRILHGIESLQQSSMQAAAILRIFPCCHQKSYIIPAIFEIILLVPFVLAVLPVTQRCGKQLSGIRPEEYARTAHASDRKKKNDIADPSRRMGGASYFQTVMFILTAVAWVLWTISAFLLVAGVVLGAKLFGLISLSALLALFAQGIGAVGFLAPVSLHYEYVHAENKFIDGCNNISSGEIGGNERKKRPTFEVVREEDDIWRETRVMEKEVVTMVADVWMHKGDDQGHEPDKSEQNRSERKKADGSNDNGKPNDVAMKFTQRSTMGAGTDTVASGKKLDVIIFFLLNTGLLQSPYYLYVGFHFVMNCVNCTWNTNSVITMDASMTSVDMYHDKRWMHSAREPNAATIPIEIPAVMALLSTIMIPLFTHGVGGEIFVEQGWDFYHPFKGGKAHVKAQATGWSLLFIAALLHLTFFILGLRTQYVYLLHSGSAISWCADGLLLYSLFIFRPQQQGHGGIKEDENKSTKILKAEQKHTQTFVWYLLSFLQDMVLTNMHWVFFFWLGSVPFGFNAFSLDPMEKLFNIPPADVLMNVAKLIFIWAIPTLIIPLSSKKKKWKWNVLGLINNEFERLMFHKNGIFHDSILEREEALENYQRDGAIFAMMPHGTLPTSVWAVWHQFDRIFADVCLFFGSQVSIVPCYRYFCGMRGGCLPVEKKKLIKVMATRQNIALVPGGVAEMLSCVPHQKNINVSIKHKGFIRLAIQQGYDLVPTFFFHANDSYDNPMSEFQLWSYKMTGIPLGLPWYTNQWCLPFSNRKPIRVALGKRISVKRNQNPSVKEVDQIHRIFYEEVYRVWEKYKDDFGYGNRELTYVI